MIDRQQRTHPTVHTDTDTARPPSAPPGRRQPRHGWFVGVDSDGCVFDTMRVKQLEHFVPLIRDHWQLAAVEPQLRDAVAFVNLDSRWRGQNRFPNLLRVFELLPGLPGVRESGVALPDLEALRAYCASGRPLGNPSLREAVRQDGRPELCRLLTWSEALNRDIDERMRPCPPFPAARLALRYLARLADLVVISQTPAAALEREWREHGLRPCVQAVAGQELGTKAEQLRRFTAGHPDPARRLMIGDAPADAEAAREAGVLFQPILPGREDASWQRLLDEGIERFQAGTFGGAYARSLQREFLALLDVDPPWKRPAHTPPHQGAP